MRASGELNTGTLNKKFQRVKKVVRMTLGGEIKRAARIVAVQLAHTTQPFGLGEDARSAGALATSTQIRKCYATPGDVYAAFEDPRLARAFYSRLKKGDIARAQALVRDHCPKYRHLEIGAFDLTLHQGRRNSRGRIGDRQTALQIVGNPDALLEYIRDEVDLVGWGKAGWVSAGRAVNDNAPGSTRGVDARWVTKHKAPGMAIDYTRNGDTPYVILVNQVSYAGDILTPADKSEAVQIGLERYLQDKRITRLVRDALKVELS